MLRYFIKYKDTLPVDLKVILDSYEEIPTTYIEVSKKEFEDILVSMDNLALAKFSAKELIDRKTGEVRLKYITSVPGQAETYMMKSMEAKELKSNNYNVSIDMLSEEYPMISGEMAVFGTDLITTCETILFVEKQWKMLASAIEKERRQANLTIDNCSTYDDIRYAIDSGIKSLEALTNASY